MRQSRARYAQVPEWVLRNPDVVKPATTLVVYTCMCMLANYRDRTGETDWEAVEDMSGLSRTVVFRAFKTLKSCGALVLRDDGMYDLPMDEPVDNSPNPGTPKRRKSPNPGTRQSQSRDARVPIPGFAPYSTETPELNSESPPAAAKRAADDPVHKHAHGLTVLAFEQPVKPVLRENGQNAFCAALAIIERTLRGGHSTTDVERAIRSGVDVWTLAGLQTAIAHTSPRARGKAGRQSAAFGMIADDLRGDG